MVDILLGRLGQNLWLRHCGAGPQEVWLALIINTALIQGLRHVKCWPDWQTTECLPLADWRFKGTITR